MKTNASIETVKKAVKKVSATLYEDNVIFRREPQHITKNVIRFTLKTKDAEGPGSLVTKNGQKHPKANWNVHLEVVKEIFRLEPKSHIYVDTIAGRLYPDNVLQDETPTEEETIKDTDKDTRKFLKALKFVLDNKHLLEKLV